MSLILAQFFASTCSLNRQRTRSDKAQNLGTPKIRDSWPFPMNLSTRTTDSKEAANLSSSLSSCSRRRCIESSVVDAESACYAQQYSDKISIMLGETQSTNLLNFPPFSINGRLIFFHYSCWGVGDAIPIKISSAGNNFPRKYRGIPQKYDQYWCYILVKFCPSVLYW